jgi:hypothetical protein
MVSVMEAILKVISMKTTIFLVIFTITCYVSIAQETIDTTDIVTSYNTDGFFVKSYHIKNQNLFAKSDNSSYYLEFDGGNVFVPKTSLTLFSNCNIY